MLLQCDVVLGGVTVGDRHPAWWSKPGKAVPDIPFLYRYLTLILELPGATWRFAAKRTCSSADTANSRAGLRIRLRSTPRKSAEHENGCMRPVRRLQRWQRSTPNSQIAMTMVGVGSALILVALLVLGVRDGWV